MACFDRLDIIAGMTTLLPSAPGRLARTAPIGCGRRNCLKHLASTTMAVAATSALPGCAFRHFPPIPYTPLLYSLRAPDAPGEITLFGGLHSGLSRFYPLPDRVEQAFAESRQLLIEVDLVAQTAAIRQATGPVALLPDGQTLEQVLSPGVLRMLHAHYALRPWDWEEVRRLQPWALTLLLPNADDVRLAASARDGLDHTLLARARAAGKPVVELEAPADQIRALASGTFAEQEATLALRLEQLQAWDRTYTQIVHAWRTGDAGALAELKDRAYPPDGPLAGLRERLFAQRDARWTREMTSVLEQPERSFALVGVLHLVGPDSLLLELSRQGIDVRPVRHD
jgi:hypothetical protein